MQQGIKKLQWFEYLKVVFLEILNPGFCKSGHKWLEVHPITTATSAVTIEKLKFIFSTHGLPDMIVSDNKSVFTSNEFTNFMKQNGITHVKASLYHPSTDGLAERAVQTFKSNMKKLTELFYVTPSHQAGVP